MPCRRRAKCCTFGHRQERAAGRPKLRHKCGLRDSGGRFDLPASCNNDETRLLEFLSFPDPCKQTPLASYNTKKSSRTGPVARGRAIFRRIGRRLGCAPSADTQLVDALHGLAAGSAKQRATVAAEQRIGSRLGAVRAVELGGRLGIGHVAIITPWDVPMWAIQKKWENRP